MLIICTLQRDNIDVVDTKRGWIEGIEIGDKNEEKKRNELRSIIIII